MAPTVAWRAPDGSVWSAYHGGCPAVRDPDTDQWDRIPEPCDTHEHRSPEDDWEPIKQPPLLDPRITRLAVLVSAVLDRAAPPEDAEIRELLAYVATLPETARSARIRAHMAGQKIGGSRR